MDKRVSYVIIIVLLLAVLFLGYSLKDLQEKSNPEKECTGSGGEWKRAGLAGNFLCVYTYSDGGESCDSSDECVGPCIVTSVENPEPSCKNDDNPFGCYNTIENYRETGTIFCAD